MVGQLQQNDPLSGGRAKARKKLPAQNRLPLPWSELNGLLKRFQSI
jgi:hypothetical protein